MNSEIQDRADFGKQGNAGGEKAEAGKAGANSAIPRPTVVGERSRSMIGQGLDVVRANAALANNSAASDQVAGVPVTTIQMSHAKDLRDSSLNNPKAGSTGKKFQPTSQRSKSFIKQAGLAYGTNQASSAYMTAANERTAEPKSKSPFSSKLSKMEAPSASSNQSYATKSQYNNSASKSIHRSIHQGAGGHNSTLQQQYQTEQAHNLIQLSNNNTFNNINDSSFNNETLAEDRSEMSPTRQLSQSIAQSVDIEQNIFDSSNSQDNVKVVVRVRPLNEREQKSGAGKAKCVQVENGANISTILLDRGFDVKKFHFDFVGQEDIEQQTMFNQIAKPIADSCMQGYNGTIFAYGQTGAGKTFTIQGPTINVEGSGDQMAIQNGTTDAKGNRGIMQRSFEYIFQNVEAQKKLIEEKADGSELSFLIKCSYLEIYNEQIMDLLEPSSINLHVREDIKKGVYVEGLQEEAVGSYRDMIQLIQKGGKNRHVGATALNRESSRSHSVLTTIIESKSMSHTGVWNMKTSRFHIIDLAGSERSKNTDAVGERLKEAGMINKSLSALGNVINSLVDLSEGKNRHVPYRDSKLTFILRDSLGGNSRTVIIANISPSNVNMAETLSTLEFARRAKQIKNRAIVNEDSSGTILILKNEIKKLKKDMMEQGRHFQELINQKKLWAQEQKQAEQICKVCRTNMRLDRAEDREFDQQMLLEEDANLNEDSLLIDSPDRLNASVRQNEMKSGENNAFQEVNTFGSNNEQESPNRAQQQKLNDRLKQAESLLAANLENLSSQQKFYEGKIAKYKEEIRSLSQSVDALNSQVSRDKMKMKLREDKIQKLEQEHGITPDENASLLQQEIKILQEQLQQERTDITNPKIAKMMSDHKMLLDAKAQLEKELNRDMGSLSVQFANQSNMIEELNDYLKTKASIEAFEALDASLSQTKEHQAGLQESKDKLQSALEDLQQEYDILLTQNVKAEEQNQKLTREYGKAKVEIQSLNEQIEALQQSSKQRVGEINQFAADIKEQAAKLSQLETTLENQNQQLDAKIEENTQLTNEIENIELELNQKENEIKSLQEEIAQKLKDIEEQETINETLHVQVEQENTQKNKLANELKEAQNQVLLNKEDFNKAKESLNQQIQDLEEEKMQQHEAMMKLKLDSDSKIQCSQQQNELKLTNMAEEHRVEVENITTRHQAEISALQKDKDETKVQITLLNQQLNTLQAQAHSKEEQASEYQTEISHLQEVVDKLKLAQQEELDKLKLHIENKSSQSQTEMQMVLAQIEEKNFEINMLKNEVADHKRHVAELQKEIESQSIENQNQKQELESAAKEATAKQSQVDELKSRAEELDGKVKSLMEELKHREEEMSTLKSMMAEQKSQYQQESSKELALQRKELKKQMQEKTEDMQSQMDTVIANLKQEQKRQLAELEMQLRDLQSKLEVERKERDAELEMYKQQVKELQGQNANHESNISYLDVSISEMNANIQDKNGLIEDLTKKNEALENEKSKLKEQQEIEKRNFQALQEEIEACKQLLAEKNEQTAGAEQETAEGQVLLLEAQDLISQKIEEVDQLEAALAESERQRDEAKAAKMRSETQIKQKDSELASMAEQIRQLNDQVAISQDLLDKQIAQFDKLKENLDSKEEELQKFENEKINLQFKRDEGTKNLEQKIKELKIQNKKLTETNENQEKELQSRIDDIQSLKKDLEDAQGGKEQQNQNLVNKLQDFQNMNEELVKEIDMLRETQEEFLKKIENEKQEHQKQLASVQQLLDTAQQEKEEIINSHKDEKSQSMLSLQEHTHKQTALLKEVSDMQVYIDELTESLNQATRAAKEVDKIKQDCYRKIEIIQTKNKSSLEKEEAKKDVEEEKTQIKNNISAVLAEISDVSQYAHNSNDQDANNKVDLLVDSQKSIEINLLISQIVCEISKLYEKQIVLEKQKASQDFKKFTDKHEKQKGDIKQMQMYHANKVNDLTRDHQQMKMELEDKKKELLELKDKHLNEQNKENEDIAEKLELANEQLKAEKEEKEQIVSELERYKVYLPEAEGLLQEVNNRHQGALDEIEQQQKIAAQYEREILDLNKNLKNLKKALQDQKQLYEVRVQSQEQEIDQHQFRYRELEKKLVDDIYQQEVKFAQVQEQVQILGQIKKQAKQDRETARKQMQEMQASVELVEQNDKIQRQEIQQLKQKIQQRENEMAEVVDSLKQFVEANRYLESENQRLTLEVELMAGHKNPQQKIQLHLKIKEENNRLREDNLRLQDDLSKKIDIIQRHQKENRAQQLFENTMSPKDKNEIKSKKEFDNLVLHIVSQPQFAKLAKSHNMNLKSQGSQSIAKVMELVSLVDDALEAKDEQIQGLRKMPPKPQGLNLQNYISKPKRNEQTVQQTAANDNFVKMSSTQKYRSPGIPESRNNVTVQGGLGLNQNLNSMGMLPPNQILMRAGSASGLKGSSSQAEGQHAPIREQTRLNSGSKRPIPPNLQGTQQLQNKLSAGSPVMLNSYSSLYKQSHSHRASSRDQPHRPSTAAEMDDNQPIQMRPEKEHSSNATVMPSGYSDLVSKQKQYRQQNQVKTQRVGDHSSKQSSLHPGPSGSSSSFNAQYQNLMSSQPSQQQRR